jgi:hypothetical protein
MEKIENLKKVSLALMTGSQETPFQFIFGIGTDGLSPFEFELAGKKEGDILELQLGREAVTEVFQHLPIPPLQVPQEGERFHLKVRVEKVSPADRKEIIKAMAEMASCGDHCCGH